MADVVDAVVEALGPRAAAVARVVFAVPRVRTVVGEEDDQRVVVLTDIPQELHHPAEVVVHVLHHAGIDFHASRSEGLFLRA
jgi:hypothetical protein